MMTSDGISTEDWDLVHEIALEVVNTSSRGDETASERATEELLALLEKLEERYGPLPSLLATRADYFDDAGSREYWLIMAFAEAERLGDSKNMTLIAHSLAAYYVQDDDRKAEHWLDRLNDCLKTHFEESEASELERLRHLHSSRGERS
jgi:hypothetical protein